MSKIQKRLDGLFRSNVHLAGQIARVEEYLHSLTDQTVQNFYQTHQVDLRTVLQVVCTEYTQWIESVRDLAQDVRENERPDVGVFADDFQARIDELESAGRQITERAAVELKLLKTLDLESPTPSDSAPNLNFG